MVVRRQPVHRDRVRCQCVYGVSAFEGVQVHRQVGQAQEATDVLPLLFRQVRAWTSRHAKALVSVSFRCVWVGHGLCFLLGHSFVLDCMSAMRVPGLGPNMFSIMFVDLDA